MAEGSKRRAETDARLEYLYSYLSDAAEISRSELQEQIHGASLTSTFTSFFLPRASCSLLLYFQDDKLESEPEQLPPTKGSRGSPPKQTGALVVPKRPALFLTNGKKVLTGIGVFFIKTGIPRPISDDNCSREIMCGRLDATKPGHLVGTIWRTFQHVFIPSLLGYSQAPPDESEYSPSVQHALRHRLIPALRSLSSSLRVWESVQKEYKVLTESPASIFTGNETGEELRSIARVPEKLAVLESWMKRWAGMVRQIVLESNRLRKETDRDGPQDEVEYWKSRASRLALIHRKIRSPETTFAIYALQSVGSEMLKAWKGLEHKVLFCFTEAKDNSAYIDRIDTICHSLYLDDPVQIQGDVHCLLQTVTMIQTTSMYYNTSERISHLLVKITNQMIHRCKEYLTKGGKSTIWTQPRPLVRQRILDSLELNKVYRKSYKQTSEKTRVKRSPDFCISENYVFGKFNSFCDRLRRILVIFDLLDGYERLFETHVCGLLWDDTLEEKEKEFKVNVTQVTEKDYNHLDYRNRDVDKDYQEFIDKTEGLKIALGKMIETNYQNIWECPQAIKFLRRIEEVTKLVPNIASVEDKYERISNYFANRIRTTRKIFHKKRSSVEPPRGMPPVGGKIMWIRSMVQQLESFTNDFASHPVLKQLAQYKSLVKEYNSFAIEAATYEVRILKRWTAEFKLSRIEEPLKQFLLFMDPEDESLNVNLSSEITTMIAEADCLLKMGIEVPLPMKVLLTKSSHFQGITDKLDMLLERFESAVSLVAKEIRPFMFPMIVRLATLFQPPLTAMNWTSLLFENYFNSFIRTIQDFGLLSFQIRDFFEFQIMRTFSEMEQVLLCANFVDLPWTLDDLLDKNYKAVREGATSLHSKSMQARDLVDELIELAMEATTNMGEDIIQQFELDKANNVLAEMIALYSTPPPTSPDKGSENSGSDAFIPPGMGSTGGGYSSPTNHGRAPPDWSFSDKLFDHPRLLHGLVAPGLKCPKELKESLRNFSEDIKYSFSKQLFEIVVTTIKNSLSLLRRRFVGPQTSKGLHTVTIPVPPGLEESTFTEDTPIFILETQLQGSTVVIKPTMEQIQEAITQVGRAIVASSKGIGLWHYVTEEMEQHHSRHLVNEKKARRRLLYRGLSQDRAGPKHQLFNYYAQICETKEVSKFTSALTNCTQTLKENFLEFMKIWNQFQFLWNPNRRAIVKKFTATNPSWVEYEEKLDECHENGTQLDLLPDYFDFRAIRIVSGKLKQSLLVENRELTVKYGVALKNRYKREMETVLLALEGMQSRLDAKIEDIEDVRMAMEALQKFREAETDLDLKIPPIEEAFFVVAKHNIPATTEEIDQAESLSYLFRKLRYSANNLSGNVDKLHPTFQKQLMSSMTDFKHECTRFCASYVEEGPMVTGLIPREASDKLAFFQNRFDALWRRNAQLASGQQLFGLQTLENTELSSIKKELNLLQKLYRLYNDVIDRVASYYDILWKDVNIEEINNELLEFQNRCRKLPKGLKEWPAFFALKKTIDDFNDICPLLELMSNKAMKPRHWQKIMETTAHEFDLENEVLCLKDILDAPLLQFKEDIEDVCISAMKERDIEAKLRQVTNEWSVNELIFVSFKTRGELLLRGDTTAETISQLEDSLMILGSLLSNRYNAPFKKNIQKYVTDLSNTNEILERWLLVQNMWVYLEAVFVGGDIAKQLPKEAKRFSKIDYAWQRIMQRAHENPSVVSCAVGDDNLKQLLPHLQEQLEICQKSLSGYLEKKRLLFPRFFFVSDPALLEILGQASDSHTIQSHLLSIFDNISTVRFHDADYNRILAINSAEGETIKLERPVKAEGSVEIWLNQLLNISRKSIQGIIREAYVAICEPDYNMIELLEGLPAQVGILALQMVWTKYAENALRQAKHDRKVMSDINNKFLDMLNQLIDQTTRNLSRIERIKFETFITIHVHQRDIFDGLCRMNVKSLTDFEWMKQCRSYFKEDSDITEIYVTDVYFAYQHEYLGCAERLCHTPLTDRCYITLAQALSMSMGGCSAGPAGTGKTETVKDMGKTLGKYVVVFNCSDQMDFRGLGRIFKGLAQSGSWGCFDEFNRIDLPVLSVAAQQIAVVLGSRRDRKKHFIFTDGELVELNNEFGIFLTMNPGYAGRQELPENLKIQFRTVAMMVPDRQIIIRVKLASCGFLENITLARKFYTLYKLCEEQLTKQVHYDFGLRNILSVLRTLGTTKRANARDAESTIVMRVLRDMNLSKLIDEDEPLFMSLIMDLFPNVIFEKTVHQNLELAIKQQVEAQGLVFHEPWVLKLVQLYETQQVRHGIMTLGPAGAGKTTCIHSLMKALTAMGTPHRELRMNPKAITAHQMFGRLDVATNDWTDGIFSALWRKTLKAKKGQADHIWLVLDGPVDSIWIENLNSVLDDNKTLTLANGDRLPMSSTCKVIFEPHNIDNASPATVSRNGMVYMSSSGLNWSPIFEAWLKQRIPRIANILRTSIDATFFKTYDWARQALVFKMPVLECNIAFQMLTLMEGLLPHHDEEEEAIRTILTTSEKKVVESEVKKIYVFALVWSIGAFLESEDRVKLDQFLRAGDMHLPLPTPDDGPGQVGLTVFDYVMEGDKWVPWKTKVDAYTFPENYINEFSSILVPNVDTLRTNFFIDTVAKQHKAVLLIGEQGSGKTVMIDAYTKSSYNPEAHLTRTMNFSFASTAYQFQKTVETYLEKRVGSTFGPMGGKRMTVFIDDINLPEISEWGDQVTNEIVRQTIEMKGFYSLEKPGDFIHIVDLQIIAAMIHPGAGRNDIPSRLKRHFSVFNCTLPTPESIDKIFGTIAMGHYNAKRGFTESVRGLITKLVGFTRILWMSTRRELKPSPSKFHYIFNLRDLSRIWQGMIGTLSTVIESEKETMQLWIHEVVRVLTDRFIDPRDKEWFDREVETLVEQKLGKGHLETIRKQSLFVDFMRDAPEATGEEGEDADVELPKVYEPIEDLSILKERLVMFLSQYNEIVRGSPMNLVFFEDAMINLVKVSRIIRSPGGNSLLVGVGGSGKQSLTKLSSFIAGYKTFQVTLTRSYNLSNFLEDLKILYRTCGAQGKGTTFIFSDQDIKEEVFLEYLNNVLSSGFISNLFNRDEHAEIITELTPIMRREMPRKSATPENVFTYFIQRMKQFLHVVLCFSPVGEKFRNRAMKFPSLISGCTINWLQPWPKNALIAVAEHFITDFPMECTVETKQNVIYVLGSIQDSVAGVCDEYFQRLRRSAHVTPKSYLKFLASYKVIYSNKLNEVRDSTKRMEIGLQKLKEAAVSVTVLKKNLAEMEEELKVASAEAERVLDSVKERAEEAEIIRNRVQKSKDIAEHLVKEIQVDRVLAEEKLEAAKPALEEAEAALNTILPAHIATVRKLGRPPHLIMRIMDCVLILFQKKLHWTFPDPQLPCPKPSWAEALKMMSSTTFLVQLQNYPKDVINEEIIDLLEPYFRMEDYQMEDAKRVCGDVAGLLSWTKAMAFFFGVNKEVLPLKANLTLQEARLRTAVTDLARLEAELLEKETELEAVQSEYDAALSKTESLTEAAETCRRKMSTAMALIDGLSGENKRWTDQSKELKEIMGRLVGDIVSATAFLAYSGPFNQEYRALLSKQILGLIVKYKIPHTEGLTVQSLLVESSEISEWTLQGLPNDELSIENAIIVTSGSSYPLLVDPQSQGKAWIKTKEAGNELMVTSLNHKYFRNHLEDSLSLGKPLLIEDVGEELDPVLDNVLEKNFIKSGTIEKVVVGDKEVDVMRGFKLYIVTKLPNPFYTPEISAKTSIIDFTVTMKGLEDQLLGRVILMEKADLEAERMALFESVMQNKRSMKGLEDSLLLKLSTSKGSLVDDEELIRVLRETKSTAEEVKVKLEVSEETESKITSARDEFRPIASRGSVLYFLVVELAKVNVMYQTSLKQFLNLFDASIKLSTRGVNTEERISIVLNRINWEVWNFVQRALFVKDRFLFTLLMALKIHLHESKISHEEFMVLIKGGASLDLSAVQPKPFKWISDITWLNLVELSKLEPFTNILMEVVLAEAEWREWEELEAPETAPLPGGFQKHLDAFRKLLLVRSWCPDRTLSQAKTYVMASLGPEFGESRILDLEATWSESDERTPLICILSIGSDPTLEIEALAKQKATPIKVVSLGQGQELFAKNLITDSMSAGSWTLLQNCHLCLPFCDEIMTLLNDAVNINPNFRLWLTTDCYPGFPISLLHAAIKFTNEPPQGIRASMKRTYQGVTQDYLDYTGSKHFSVLLYSVAFLHTIVQERRKFGPLGWNVPYEFNKADFTASVQFIQHHLEELNPRKQIISWPTVCYMIGEVQYGGRVTDDFDKRLLNTITTSWFCEAVLHGHFEFSKGYRAPCTKNLIVINDVINNLPIRDSPEVFGLHPNADITYQINAVKSIFEAILGVQPKQSGSGGGESRESVVYRLADDMLKKLPLPYVSFEVKDALVKLGALLPMNIFLRQELDRMGKILFAVRETLSDLKLAIDGTIIMSPLLRDSLDAMYDARVPPSWKKISWDSSSIGFWFTELLERYNQFRNWLTLGKPRVFWMTGFFNPQGFLTAMRQEVTRAHKGWALDSVVLQNVVTRFWKEDITEAPMEGVYVHGLYVEGASVEKRSGKLVESKPKVLYEPVPVVFIFSVNTTSGKDPRLYECPIYRKPRRSDANYIGSIDFQTDATPKHWVMRGVALLCDIK